MEKYNDIKYISVTSSVTTYVVVEEQVLFSLPSFWQVPQHLLALEMSTDWAGP